MRFALGDGGHEPGGDARQIGAEFRRATRVDAAHQVVLLVCHDPRAGWISVIPGAGGAEVAGFHRAVAIVAAVDLGIAVVEAATAVVVLTIDDPVHTLGLVVDRDAVGVVVAETHAGLDENAVRLVSADGDRRHVRDREVVEAAHGRAAESAPGRLGQVIVLGRLVVERRDQAGRAGAEPVLRGRVGIPAPFQDTDVPDRVVREPPDLVERAMIGGVQRAGGAVGGDAGSSAGGVDVTRARRCGRPDWSGRAGGGGRGERGSDQRDRDSCDKGPASRPARSTRISHVTDLASASMSLNERTMPL
jgi:hypothetical protein